MFTEECTNWRAGWNPRTSCSQNDFGGISDPRALSYHSLAELLPILDRHLMKRSMLGHPVPEDYGGISDMTY